MKTINVKGMHCTSCEVLITEGLLDAGASKATADFKKGTVQYDGLDDKKAKATIEKEGYQVRP